MSRTYDCEVTATVMGIEVDLDVNYSVTSWGSPGGWTNYGGDPPEPMEIEINSVKGALTGVEFRSLTHPPALSAWAGYLWYDKDYEAIEAKVYEHAEGLEYDHDDYDPREDY